MTKHLHHTAEVCRFEFLRPYCALRALIQDSKIDNLAAKVDSKIDSLTVKVDSTIDNLASKVDLKIDSLTVKVDGLAETVAEQGVTQDKLILSAIKTEAGVKELLEWKVEITKKVDGLVDSVDGLAHGHQKMECEVAALHSKTDRHAGRLTRLERGMKLTVA